MLIVVEEVNTAVKAWMNVTTQVRIQVSNAKAQRCKERKERKGYSCFFIALRPLQLGVFALEAD